MTDTRPLASVSLDVDNLWSYLKTHGDAGWESRPSYLDAFFPPLLDALDELGLRITFFCVGVDAAQPGNRRAFQSLISRGHEVGNHSFQHEPWLHLYPRDRLEADIVRGGGRARPGNRSPTDRVPRAGLQLESRSPRGIGGPRIPLRRINAADLHRPARPGVLLLDRTPHPAQRAERKQLFGSFRDGLRPVKPYRWSLSGGRYPAGDSGDDDAGAQGTISPELPALPGPRVRGPDDVLST